MKLVLFGATGMVGQGVLRECLLAADVEKVLIIGRTPSGADHPKVKEIVHRDLLNYAAIEQDLLGFDACFFCLGVSSAGMKQEQYERITYGITIAAAETLARLNPPMTFIYVSGTGTDSSESGRVMWARVKGRTENTLLRMPFQAAYMLRPGVIQPKYGARSKTALYQFFYTILGPVPGLFHKLLPNYILTTEEIGQAMLALARNNYPNRVLETKDIRDVVRKYVQPQSRLLKN